MRSLFDFIADTADGVLAVDRAQRIVFWNTAASDILHFDNDEVLGRFCYDVLGGTNEYGCCVCQRDCPAIRTARRRRIMPTQELRARTKEGAEVWLSVSTVLIPLRWNDLAVLVHFFRDVGRRKELERGVVALFGRLSSIVDTSTLRSGRTASAPTATTPLTRREQEILRLLASGNSTDTLADTLCISRATVRNHVHSILRKLGVRSRLEAVTLGLRRGLI